MSDVAKIQNHIDNVGEGLKVPPHSIEAEQSVLGGLMLDYSAWDKIADVLYENDFYRHDHRTIFKCLAALTEKNSPLDVITVSEWLDTNNQLEDVGGLPYLGMLAKNTPSATNIVAYAKIVRERSVLRQLVRVGNDITDAAFNPEGRDSKEILDSAESAVFGIAEQDERGKKSYSPVKEILPVVVEKIDKLSNSTGELIGVSTGFSDIDKMTSGLQPSDLIIVAGRPSMGKTSFAMNIAESVAIKSDTPVAIFSMEMPDEQLVLRMLSSLGRIDQSKVRTGQLTDEDWPRMTSTMNLLSEATIIIDDTPALTPTELRARARRIKREHGLGVIVVDYLQLMQVPGTKENRTNEISEISRNLKSLAKELDVPVIALSQLNRSLEQRPNKRPVMSDLRESGAIEQDADVIMFIYRDEVYNEDSLDKGIAEIIIGKQRNGPIGTARLTFLGQFTRFENYIDDRYGSEDYA